MFDLPYFCSTSTQEKGPWMALNKKNAVVLREIAMES